MNAQVEITSIAMSKNDPKITKLDKYDVEANIEEVDNNEDQSVFKYGFTALSNPKNVRLAIEGTALIFGDSTERNEILEKDENDVPKILTMIYHELFPTFFLLSKNLNVSCPPHTIGTMGDSPVMENKELSESQENVVEETPDTVPPPAETVSPPAETVSPPAETVSPPAETVSPPAETTNIEQPTV